MNKRTASWIFIILMLASVIASLAQTALNTALPAIMSNLKVDSATGQWLTSGYTLVMGIMVPATAYFMKRFSTRQLFIGALSLFTIGSLVAWLGLNFELLLVGRILEAMGRGFSYP
nr:MFS transporter [Limosilactobacillus gastricus]